MTLVAVSRLRAGMRLAGDIRLRPGTSAPHLRRGQELTEERRRALIRAGLLVVDIELGCDEADEIASPASGRERGASRALGQKKLSLDSLPPFALAGRGVRRRDGRLVPLGTPLGEDLVDELRRAGVDTVEILAGEPARTRWAATSAARSRAGLLQTVLRERVSRRPPAAYAVVESQGRAAAEALDQVIETAAWFPPIALLVHERSLASDFLTRSLDVALLAAITGAGLGIDDQGLYDLALAAFLADIGMLTIPEYYSRKPGRLSRVERGVMETHVERGLELVLPLNPVVPLVRHVVAQHHERIDGRGYPAGLSGAEIRPEAQIVAVCQRYAAATSERSYRARISEHEAHELLITIGGSVAEPEIVEAFRRSVTPFPAGALVRLSDGTGGVVVRGGTVSRPIVEVMWDGDGEPAPRRRADLAQELTLFITAVEPPASGRGGPGLTAKARTYAAHGDQRLP